MIAVPAVDIRSGLCVQLVGGSYDHEVVCLPDPLAVARHWAHLGFEQLHVIDLDGATGRGGNMSLIHTILSAQLGSQVQVGGGVRAMEQVAELLSAGAARVVVGTRAMEDRGWLSDIARQFPARLIVAADVRDRQVLTHGWAAAIDLDIVDALQALDGVPLAGVLVTAVHREGRLGGPDIDLMQLVVKYAPTDVYAAGGIATIADLRRLAACGVRAAVIGMALYTGALDPGAVAAEFCA